MKAVTALHTRPANHGTPCHKVSESHLIEPCRNASACCLQCIWVFQEVFHDVAINEQLKVFIASCMVTSSSDAQLREEKTMSASKLEVVEGVTSFNIRLANHGTPCNKASES